MIPFVDLKGEFLRMKKDIDKAVSRVMNSGYYILGKEVEEFEKEFAGYCGAKYGVGVGSGTEALHLSLLAHGVRSGDLVATTANISVPTVSAISFTGAEPVFIDIEPETFNMDPVKLREAFKKRSTGKRIKAVVPVHLYGNPAEMAPIMSVARKYGAKVIEDAAQAHGALYHDRRAGSIADAGCFSFYPTKNLGTYGDGGIVVTDDHGISKKLRMLRNYGEKKKYFNVIKGYNSRLDEIHAAILRAKLKSLDKQNDRRRELACLYNVSLTGTGLILPAERKNTRHVYHLYVIRTKKRNMLQKFLKKKGILTCIHYPKPVHLQKAYKKEGIHNGDLYVTEKVSKEVLSLPLFPGMGQKAVIKVSRAVKSFFNV